MTNQRLINNWADALMALIPVEHEARISWQQQVREVYVLFQTHPQWLQILHKHEIPLAQRQAWLQTTLHQQVDPLFINALHLMMDRSIFYLAFAILKLLGKKLNAAQGAHYGRATSAVPLTPTQLKTLNAKLSARLGYEVHLVNRIDPSMLGGVRVNIQGFVIDGSLQKRLQIIKQHLQKKALEH